jgi:hypothetical protein
VIDTLVAVLGWEDRFFEGIKRNIVDFKCKILYLIVFDEYMNLSSKNLPLVEKLCHDKKIKLEIFHLLYKDPIATWQRIGLLVNNNIESLQEVLVDISTMPRETVWTFFFFLRHRGANIRYIYYKPKTYGDWLCKEPDKPRLLYKHSGITEFGKPTVLIILTGFDYDRTSQLVRYYEPALTVLGIQEGVQFDNQSRNVIKSHEEECNGQTEVQSFEINSYSNDYGFNVLEDKISTLKDSYNIILASLGPKVSSIAVYKVFLAHPEIALTYVPTKEYNQVYSMGINDIAISGKF